MLLAREWTIKTEQRRARRENYSDFVREELLRVDANRPHHSAVFVFQQVTVIDECADDVAGRESPCAASRWDTAGCCRPSTRR